MLFCTTAMSVMSDPDFNIKKLFPNNRNPKVGSRSAVHICSHLSGNVAVNELTEHFRNFLEKKVSLEQCKGVHCVDLGESFPTSIYLQNLVSIQPRMSPVKFAARRGPSLTLGDEQRGDRRFPTPAKPVAKGRSG